MSRPTAWATALIVMLGIMLAPLPAGAVPGAPAITGYPSATVETPYAAFSFDAPGATSYDCRVFPAGTASGSRPAYADCGTTGSHRTEALTDGAWTFEVRGRDGSGPGPSSTRDWEVTSDPVVQWVIEPVGGYTARVVSATFTAAGASSFECRVDGGGFGSCGNGQRGHWTSPLLETGPHTLQVRAYDGGDPGPVATATFTVAEPLGLTWLDRPPSTLASRVTTARFTAGGATSYECRIVPTTPEPASVPGFTSCGNGRNGRWLSEVLADGGYRLDVQAKDMTGTGPTASTEFTVQVDGGLDWVTRPTGTLPHRAVAATFRAPTATHFECRAYRTDPLIDPLPEFSSCGNGRQGHWRSGVLQTGDWRLDVRASDTAGHRPVASTDFTVSRPLTVQWGVQPTGALAGTGYAAAFHADGATGYECRLDEGDWVACGTGRQGHTRGVPGAGTHTLEVRARDEHAVGPVAATTFALSEPGSGGADAQITLGPIGATDLAWTAFAWTAEDAGCFRYELDGDDDDLSNRFCYDPDVYGASALTSDHGDLADGTHVLRVQAEGVNGTLGAVARRTFEVDTTEGTRPVIVTGPGEGATIASAWVTASWAAGQASCLRWELDGSDDDLSNRFCYDPAVYGSAAASAAFEELADGPHTLRVQASSLGGTFGPVTSRNFVVDTTGATRARITSGPVGASTVDAAWAAFAWESDQVGCYRWELDEDGDLGNRFCYDPTVYGQAALRDAFDNLPDGNHTLRVQARSLGGTLGPVTTRTFSVDTATPVRPRIVSGPAEGVTIPTPWAAFSWSSGQAECVRWEIDDDGELGNRFCYDPAVYGAQAVADRFADLADGKHTLRLQGRSLGGTWGPITTRTFIVNSGPWVTVSSRPRQVLPTGTAAFAWTAPGAECFRWEVDDDGDLGNRFCYDPTVYGATAHSDAVTGLVDGAHVLLVQARSAGGALGPVTEVPFTVETKAPETAITAGPDGYVSSTGATFAFTADETATFECSLNGGPYATCTTPRTLSGLSQGEHTFAVRAVDLAGKTDATPASRTWTVDTVAPTITDLTAPTGVVVDPDFTATLTFEADEPSSFVCRLVPAAFTPCASGVAYDDLPDGDYRFEVEAVDRAGNRSLTEVRTWTIVTDPPETTITSAPSGPVSSTSATIAFSSPDSPVTFECKVDGAAYASCDTPLQLSGLAQGAHAVLVRAVFAGSLRDPSPAIATWTVDTVGPTTTITSGPSGPVGAGPASFTFTADEPATFTCRLDGGTPYACASPESLGSLGSGSHTFVVRATDTAGNLGPEVSRSWTVDSVAPVVTITGHPPALTQQTSGTVTFTVDDASATVECRLDGSAWVGCTSPATRTGLADGTHTFEVRALDPVGNVSEPASAQWRVDTVAPVVTITTGPGSTINSSSARLGFTVSEPADTVCRVDAGAYTPCTSPYDFTGLAEGQHTLQVRATDAAGNTGLPAERTVNVDTVAPTVTITGGPTDSVAQTTATFTFTVDESPVTTRCSLDEAAFAVCTSPATYTGLDQGSHTLRVRATDSATNTGPIASRTWSVDTPEPETSIDSAPVSPSNDTSPTFAFSSDTAGSTFECRLDSAVTFTTCTSGIEVGPLPDGSHTFLVRAVAGGLTDPTPANHTWTVDATAPVVTVTQRPIGVTTIAGSRFAFSVSEAGTTECQVDGGAWQACSSPFDPVLADGGHTVRIRATDAAGNVGQTLVMPWTVDGTEPDVVITSGPSGSHASRTATYTFTVDDPTAVVECLLDGGSWAPCTSPRNLTGLEDGPHSFSVRATDPAGNRGGEGRVFFVDATPPVVTFTSGPPAGTTARTAHLVFTVDDASASLTCSFDGGPFAPCSSPFDRADLADGQHNLQVRATDPFGNTGSATRTWVVDNTPPTVTITAGPSGTVTTDDVSFSFTADDDPVMYECRLDADAFAPCATPRALDDLAVGNHRFEVRATNAAGLRSEVATRDFTVAVAGDPDLRVTVSPTALSGAALTGTGLGDDFVMSTTVRNVGVAASDATVLTVPVSADLRPVGALPVGCTYAAGQRLMTCAVGSVPANAARTLDLRVEAAFTCTVYGDSAAQAGAAARLLGTTGDDIICGGGGGDEILGRGGNDIVWGYGPTGLVSTGASVAYGPGARSATATPASVMIAGADGDDTVTTAQGTDTVRSQAGDDRVTTGAGTDTVEADTGDDRVDTGTGNSFVTGGAGADTITGGAGADTVSGGDDGDTITSYDGADSVSGDGGNDILNAGAGANMTNGGTGDDRITGSTGLVNGDDGTDTITGTTGTVNGGEGGDTISRTDGTVNGGGGGDTIAGTSGPDVIHGNAGRDTITASGGDDSVTGDEDDDTINAGAGNNTVSGGSGDDRISGSSGLVNGDDGGDIIVGTSGPDVIHGNAGGDTITASGGDDVVTGDEDGDTINAGSGHNTVSGGPGNDNISGSSGVINGDDGQDTITGTTGTVNGGEDRDLISGTAGTANGQGGNDEITGTGAANVLNGGSGDDTIGAGGGSDTVNGGDGTDILRGEAGIDTIYGSFGGDRIEGGDGADLLYGDTGDDTMLGDAGNDVVDGDEGVDKLYGGVGNDRISGGILPDELFGEAGDDDLDGGDGTDTLSGGDGDDSVSGNDAADDLSGNDGDDVILGGPGQDRAFGGAGHDYLAGGADADYVNGMLGRDVVRGGEGSDELDGGGTDASRQQAPRDHWNRLYGDEGDADICHFGPGLGLQMTNYRDPTCELRDTNLPVVGEGWLNGSAVRLDRVRSDGDYPG